MISGQWRWLKRLAGLLAVPRPEAAESAQRIVALQRNIILPARLLVLVAVYYQVYSTPSWLGVVVTTYAWSSKRSRTFSPPTPC
jgi:hypothetical protein